VGARDARLDGVGGAPAYLVLLVALVVVGAVLLVRARRPRAGGWRRAGRIAAAVVLVGVLAATAWLRPFAATAPATASGDRIEVVDTATAWVLRPTTAPRGRAWCSCPARASTPAPTSGSSARSPRRARWSCW
jgi:hypothetical protein